MHTAEYPSITRDEAALLARTILTAAGFAAPHVAVMSRNMLDAQEQECHSHGLYRLILCSRAARQGGVDPQAMPVISDAAAGLVRADAQGGCSLLAFEQSLDMLTRKARQTGLAALAISNCYHYSALWWEVEQLAAQGFVGLAMTPTHPYVAPFGGTVPLLGTNPLAFSWPRPDGSPPYSFDFATSAAARGEVELKARTGEALPEGWSLDAEGNPTTDAEAALNGALLTFGGHKGSAISTMIELLAGPLIGEVAGYQTAPAGTDPARRATHGELILAFDPKVFGADFSGAEALFDQIIGTGARLPSQRRQTAGAASANAGKMKIEAGLLAELRRLAEA
ncbi:Ldh family oxidoreductase [Falsirhodobacter sp. alg1]|uniref:Ldh family oxidoreductase n=1 Tax=Falsirhodobacter sp. alg1 TaxID=1472418 RepID=UPI0005EF331E|nr:Ldh family oxidoreductase [Falsirhodobacter sp. alg1]